MNRKSIIASIFAALIIGVLGFIALETEPAGMEKSEATGAIDTAANVDGIGENEAGIIALAAAPGTVIEAELDDSNGQPAWFIQIRQGNSDIRQVVVNPRDGTVLSSRINQDDDGEAP